MNDGRYARWLDDRISRPAIERATRSEAERLNIAMPNHQSHDPSKDWRRQPIVRLLSSLRFGVTLIALVVAYASVMSALPQIRGALEMTEMQAFGHWLFVSLISVLCLSVTVATFARIRFNLLNAGVLTVHAGLLLLCLSSIWYFGTKVEGDVLLQSPRIELLSLSTSAPPRVIASLLPEVGRTWATVMPAFGGKISMEVVATEPVERVNPDRTTLQVRIGEKPAVTITVAGEDVSPQPVDGRLAVRLARFAPARTFYDHERPALYGRRAGESEWTSAEVRGLPLYRERYADEGYTLRDTDGQAVASKRCRPSIGLGPLEIPTGWFERWRLPIPAPIEGAPFEVQITGFVPYVAEMRAAGKPVIEPLERRRASLAARSASAIRLKFTGRGAYAGWSESRWLMFSQYPDLEAQPLRVSLPDSTETWEIVYSRLAHDLGAELTAGRLSVKFFPGRQSVDSWRSDFLAQHDDWDNPVAASVYTNQTWSIGPWTLFQSGAAQDHWSYTILGVGNRRGIWPMLLGCVMITFGCLYAFYVKPVLRRRIVARALANVSHRSAVVTRGRDEMCEPEPVESVS